MRELHIIFRGTNYNIENIVDEETFEKRYKPAGWEVVGQSTEQVAVENELKSVEKIKALNEMKRKRTKKFDDGLIKGESNGKI